MGNKQQKLVVPCTPWQRTNVMMDADADLDAYICAPTGTYRGTLPSAPPAVCQTYETCIVVEHQHIVKGV